MQDWADQLQQHLRGGRTNAAAWMFLDLVRPEGTARLEGQAWKQIEEGSLTDPYLYHLVNVVRSGLVTRDVA